MSRIAGDGTRRESTPLFIVDNTADGRNGLGYLREWCEIADAFDIATGYFEAGALVALDGAWQKLDKIRILMGDEVARGTKQVILQAIRGRAETTLDRGLDDDKDANPFLSGVPAIVEALKTGKIECRVYNATSFTRRRTSHTGSSTSSARRHSSGLRTSRSLGCRRTSS
jgi:hypothetical protein